MSANNKKTLLAQVVCICIVICSLYAILLIIYLNSCFIPNIFEHLDSRNVSVATDPSKTNTDSKLIAHSVNQLTREGTLMSAKDFWQFQGSFYQTIITFLIAINGLIAAFSVIYIRSSSHEKTEEATRKHLDSRAFKHDIDATIESKTYELVNQTLPDWDNAIERLNNYGEKTELHQSDITDIKQNIYVISKKLSHIDPPPKMTDEEFDEIDPTQRGS